MTTLFRGFARMLAAGLLLSATSAFAIIGGVPDGDDHPNVVMILAMVGKSSIGHCTGTLVSPTIVLTAAHCFDPAIWGEPLPDRYVVMFQSQLRLFETGPNAGAYVIEGHHEGTPHVDPRYFALAKRGSGTAQFLEKLSYDLAVFVLNQPVQEIAPAPIVAPNALDVYAIGTRNRFFTQVGYGLSRELEPPVSGGLFFGYMRNQVETPLKRLLPLILELQGNYRDTRGTGGSCSGDSGGPVFADQTLVAVHSYGGQNMLGVCNNTGGNVRLDTESARSFLRQFGLVQ